MKIYPVSTFRPYRQLAFKSGSFFNDKQVSSDEFNSSFGNTATNPDAYIEERLGKLKNSIGDSIVPPVIISLLKRECHDKKGLASLIGTLDESYLQRINWRESANLLCDNLPDYETSTRNATFLNSFDKNTAQKIANPLMTILLPDLHYGAMTEALKNPDLENNTNIKKIFIKSEKIGDNEYKNVYRFTDEDSNLIAKETVLFDSQKTILLKEHERIVNGPDGRESIREIEDLRLGKKHHVRSDLSELSNKTIVPNFEFSVDYGEFGVEKIAYRRKSPVRGIYNVTEIAAGEEPVELAKAVKTKSGISIDKTLKSFEGVTTEYHLVVRDDGSRDFVYTITDKDGNLLMDKHSKVRRTSERSSITTMNGHTYLVTFDDDNYAHIEDLDREKSYVFDLENYIDTKDKDLLSFLVTFEAPALYKLFKNTDGLRIKEEWHTSHYNVYESFDILCDMDMFDICHELGHAIDYNNGATGSILLQLSTDDEFRDIYNSEYETFVKNSTITQRDYMRRSRDTDYAKEAFADAYALLNMHQSQEEIASRAEYFQQYFPRTIAYVNKTIGSL